MKPDTLSAEHHAVARRMVGRGFRVIIGYGKGGFWVRNPDMTRPPFVDHNSFLPRCQEALHVTRRSD
jgi:hypothetical protein